MSKNNAYRDGKVHVCKEMCSTCIFRPGNLMQLRPGRVAQMVKQAVKNDSAIVCHKSLESRENAVCYGFFNSYQTFPLRLAAALGNLQFVDTTSEKT